MARTIQSYAGRDATAAFIKPKGAPTWGNDGQDEARARAFCEGVRFAAVYADALSEALRECITTPGAIAERSHEYALRRLASITATASEALAAYESKVQQ
jgi:hypothetical protein